MHNSFSIIFEICFTKSSDFSLCIQTLATNYKSKDKTQLTLIKLEKVNVKRKSDYLHQELHFIIFTAVGGCQKLLLVHKICYKSFFLLSSLSKYFHWF